MRSGWPAPTPIPLPASRSSSRRASRSRTGPARAPAATRRTRRRSRWSPRRGASARRPPRAPRRPLLRVVVAAVQQPRHAAPCLKFVGSPAKLGPVRDAVNWEHALATGNGRQGALCWGEPDAVLRRDTASRPALPGEEGLRHGGGREGCWPARTSWSWRAPSAPRAPPGPARRARGRPGVPWRAAPSSSATTSSSGWSMCGPARPGPRPGARRGRPAQGRPCCAAWSTPTRPAICRTTDEIARFLARSDMDLITDRRAPGYLTFPGPLARFVRLVPNALRRNRS